MIEDSYCARENEKLNCVVLIIKILIRLYVVNHHLILFIHNFIFVLGLASKSRNWPRPRGPGLGLGLGLEILASFNINCDANEVKRLSDYP